MDASALPCLPLPDISLCICAHVSPSKDTSRTGSGPTLKASPGSSAEAHITRSLGRAPVLELWEDTAQFTAGDLGMETDLSQQRSCERRRGRRRPPPQGRTSAHLASCPPSGGGQGGLPGVQAVRSKPRPPFPVTRGVLQGCQCGPGTEQESSCGRAEGTSPAHPFAPEACARRPAPCQVHSPSCGPSECASWAPSKPCILQRKGRLPSHQHRRPAGSSPDRPGGPLQPDLHPELTHPGLARGTSET